MDTKTKNQLTLWLSSALLLIFLMVIIGGITRLTRSGLSMVEWHPISGVIPPMNESAWQAEFEKYQQYPEYKKLNQGMRLDEFKFIFFWEYVHRLIGRLLGIFFIIPFAYFLVMKKLNPRLIRKLILMFAWGGLQGLYGWYMVKSGLVDVPHVSHYRLAGHLILAFGLMAYILWTILSLHRETFIPSTAYNKEHLSSKINWLLSVIILQIIYGAFVAGLKAGYGWNTFPKMAGQWVPDGLLPLSPWYINFTEHNLTVQFIHRILGWFLCMLIPGYWRYTRGFTLSPQQDFAITALMNIVILQFLLGMLTLIWVVPVWLGVAHQAGAVILVLSGVYCKFLLDNVELKSSS
ncbi:MAG: COX15/CtaA family protein [Candidatus Marinimicrobia bacterium]|jgi:cytochrome c oxidase assembly protein subunit 15|nr:COX15/CtaA family protein [Candidatus Neomarinimicrobiota bacterium]